MIPEKVLNAIYEQLMPLMHELAKYASPTLDTVSMRCEVGTVTFEFKKNKDETNN